MLCNSALVYPGATVATVMKADGKITVVHPRYGKYFTLAEIESYVGGVTQIVKINSQEFLHFDDDGCYKQRAPNVAATRLAGVPVAGTAILVGITEKQVED